MNLARSQYNFQPTDEEVVWLTDIGRLVETPPKAYPHTDGLCFSIGGHTFNPLTVKIRAWYVIAAPAFHGTPKELLALAYACEFPDELERLTDPAEIVKRVDRYERRCNLTDDQLSDAIDWILNIDPLEIPVDSPLDDEERASITQYIQIAVKHFGGSFDDWLNAPEQRLFDCVDVALRAEGKTERKEQSDRAMKAHLFAFGIMLEQRGIDLDG